MTQRQYCRKPDTKRSGLRSISPRKEVAGPECHVRIYLIFFIFFFLLLLLLLLFFVIIHGILSFYFFDRYELLADEHMLHRECMRRAGESTRSPVRGSRNQKACRRGAEKAPVTNIFLDLRRVEANGDVQICENRVDDLSSLAREGPWRKQMSRIASCRARLSSSAVGGSFMASMQMLSACALANRAELRVVATCSYDKF